MALKRRIEIASLAALAGLVVHLAGGYLLAYPFLTDAIGEWIMARTPSAWAVPLMESMGEWAKPFASTGGLATLGCLLFGAGLVPMRWMLAVSVPLGAWALGSLLPYASWVGTGSFFVPAALCMAWLGGKEQVVAPLQLERRRLLSAVLMPSGTALVAIEAFARNRALAARAVTPTRLHDVPLPATYRDWGDGLVRKALTPVREFYVMSKNTVDPAPDPQSYRLRIQIDGRTVRELSYAQLLGLPRHERFVSLRCVSNTLKSNLMGTGYWSGIGLEQLVRREDLPAKVIEMAVIGLDGHGDSFRLDYAFSGEPLFAIGMNGETLARNHGFPIRMLSPRYYGFKSVKWIDRIDFVSTPYFGTWPKLGYTKEPLIHPGSYVDRVERRGGRWEAGGIAYSGHGAPAAVELRMLNGDLEPLGPWEAAVLEAPLSRQTFTRWRGGLAAGASAVYLEARMRDASGRWQATIEKPLFPDGVSGPTRKRLS